MLLKNILPADNELPKNHYEAKKILCPVGIEYQKIHACRNDCILYKDDFAEMHFCPMCGVSRYRLNDGDSSVHPIATNRHPANQMDSYNILQIVCNGRQLIVCILILGPSLEV